METRSANQQFTDASNRFFNAMTEIVMTVSRAYRDDGRATPDSRRMALDALRTINFLNYSITVAKNHLQSAADEGES